MISVLIQLLIVIGVIVILWWGYTQIAPSMASLPLPLRVIVVILFCILAIAALLWIAGSFTTLPGIFRH